MPTQRTRQEIIDQLTQCGTLSYKNMIDLIYSIFFFTDGTSPDAYLSKLVGTWSQGEANKGKYDIDYFVSYKERIYRSTINNNTSVPEAPGNLTWIMQSDKLSSTLGFKGKAVPATNPGVPSSPEFWIGEPGVYPNFGNQTITGVSGFLMFNAGNWSVANINIDLTGYMTKDFADFGGRFLTVSDANQAIQSTVVNGKNQRDGKRVNIGAEGNYVTYWWKGGFNDENLVVFNEADAVFKDNPYIDYLFPVVDSLNRFLGGWRLDGSFEISKWLSENIPGSALKKAGINEAHLTEDLKSNMLQPLDPSSGYIYAILDSSNRILLGIKTDGSVVFKPETQELEVLTYGDSLTAGAGGSGVTYPIVLGSLLGGNFKVINNGVGGETAPTIAARQGGVPAVITQEFILPADTSPITISTVASNKIRNTLYGAEVSMLKQGAGVGLSVNPCYIQGIECTLTWVGANSTDPNGSWTIKRNVAATESKKIIANSILTTSAAKKYRKPFAQVLWVGQNGGYSTDAELVDYYKRMIDFSDCNNYILIGLHSGTASERASLEKAMSDAFGQKYINWREYASVYGLSDAGITPTQADITAMAAGKMPPSLLFDAVHLLGVGYTVLANLIYRRFKELGYIQ